MQTEILEREKSLELSTSTLAMLRSETWISDVAHDLVAAEFQYCPRPDSLGYDLAVQRSPGHQRRPHTDDTAVSKRPGLRARQQGHETGACAAGRTRTRRMEEDGRREADRRHLAQRPCDGGRDGAHEVVVGITCLIDVPFRRP